MLEMENDVLSRKSVAIDCISESGHPLEEGCAVVVIDVIRSITVAATAVESGRRCFFASSVETAFLLAKTAMLPQHSLHYPSAFCSRLWAMR